VVLDDLAGQLGIADASQVKGYLEKEKTRFEHRWEISRVDGWSDVASYRNELTRWVDHRTRATGDGPRAIFGEAAGLALPRRLLVRPCRERSCQGSAEHGFGALRPWTVGTSGMLSAVVGSSPASP
jgi:Domain of unknown function (DUF4158)